MKPTPLCKTAIISFIIDQIPIKLWNISLLMRKRIQMILENKDIIVSKYTPNLLTINGWVKVEVEVDITETKNILKGVSCYSLESQEQIDKVISLNQKLRCCSLAFTPEIPFECDSIEFLELDNSNYDFYLKCTFRRIQNLSLNCTSKNKIEQFLTKISRIDCLSFSEIALPDLNLTLSKIKRLRLKNLKLTKTFHLPNSLEVLEVFNSTGMAFKNTKKVSRIEYFVKTEENNPSYKWIEVFKGLKSVYISSEVSKYFDYLPSSLRWLSYCKFDEERFDLAKAKEKLPYFLRIGAKVPVEMGETLKLRDIEPIMSKTEQQFTFRPRRIVVNEDNVEELNNHPELFEKVEKIQVNAKKFNFDCLTEKTKIIELNFHFVNEEIKATSWENNAWKFNKTEITLFFCEKPLVRAYLNPLKTAKIVRIYEKHDQMREDYPHLQIELF